MTSKACQWQYTEKGERGIQLCLSLGKICTDGMTIETFEPCIVHVDFELAMLKCFKQMFPTTKIQRCRFHLRQSWWRKVQKLGLSKEYKEKDCDIGKWLASFFWFAIFRC